MPTINDMANELHTEDVPSLEEFATEPGGAWPNGWYTAEIIEGYATQRGKVFATEDTLSQKGDSRNMRLCFRVNNASSSRTMQENFNYRASDFTPERLSFIKQAREEYKNVKGRWSDPDAQRSSLAIATLGQLQKAVGQGFKRNSEGNLLPAALVGKKVDVRLSTDDKGYNVINAFAPAGTKAGR